MDFLRLPRYYLEAHTARRRLGLEARALGVDADLAVDRADEIARTTTLDTVAACERVRLELRAAEVLGAVGSLEARVRELVRRRQATRGEWTALRRLERLRARGRPASELMLAAPHVMGGFQRAAPAMRRAYEAHVAAVRAAVQGFNAFGRAIAEARRVQALSDDDLEELRTKARELGQ